MRIFVTGATGWVGSAVVRDLIAAGHEVLGLSRSEAGLEKLRAEGATPMLGTLDDLDRLKDGARWAEAVIHTAFNHDFSQFAASCEQDRIAITVLGEALLGSGHPLIVTSGLARLADGRAAIEADLPAPPSAHYPRASEATARAMAARGVPTAVVRLAGSVHGQGDYGFVPLLIRLAREKGISAYIGEGENRWAAVHRDDAAPIYRLAIERAPVEGAYHAVGDTGVPVRAIAEVIGRKLGIPVKSLTGDEAGAHFGWFAHFAGIDMAATAERTQSLLGWQPRHKTLLEDLEEDYYFAASA